MGLKERLEKLKRKKKELQNRAEELKQRGRKRTEQQRAEKIRKKKQQSKYYEPGTIKYGLAHKQHPLDLMRDTYERRKQKRKEKENR